MSKIYKDRNKNGFSIKVEYFSLPEEHIANVEQELKNAFPTITDVYVSPSDPNGGPGSTAEIMFFLPY